MAESDTTRKPLGWRSAEYRKNGKFSFSSFVLEEQVWALKARDTSPIFTLTSYVLSTYCLVNVIFSRKGVPFLTLDAVAQTGHCWHESEGD